MSTTKTWAIIAACVFLSACWEDDDERYDSGFGDGYAAGYNTTCKIRSTLIEGDWDSAAYSRGYNEGYVAGSADCLAKSN